MTAPLPSRSGRAPEEASALTFAKPSAKATDVLRLQTYPIPSPSSTEVVVQLLAAPINPQDFLIVSDIYPIKPVHRISNEPVPGYDGVGRVLQAGSNVKTLKVGDLVIPRGQGFGTWRTHAVTDEASLGKVPGCQDVRYASILKMTLLPAYFLVEDLRPLKPGDWIVQNAATSSIAQTVAQFARLKGAHTVGIFRDSANEAGNERTREMLMARGTDVALSESEFENNADELEGKRVVLALDSVWGRSAEVMATKLPSNALFVNYGNLSGGGPAAKIQLSHSTLFWQTATLRGWKSTSSLAQRSPREFDDLTGWVISLLDKGLLQMPRYRSVPWALDADKPGDLEARLKDALDSAQGEGLRKSKCIFEFRR